MDCAAVKPRMEALVNGSLPESERSLAEQHISICEGCRLELELVRAIGSQEKAPAVGKDDWTLDRIFGAEKDSGGASPGASAASASDAAKDSDSAQVSSPEASPPGDAAADSMFGPMEAVSSAAPSTPRPPVLESFTTSGVGDSPRKRRRAESTPAEGASWGFEPADAKSNVKPPEQSLFFATEALTRRKDGSSKKGSNLRMILWGAGGLVGAALLAFSSWFVLHMNAPAPSAPSAAPPPAAGAPETPPEAPPANTPVPGTVQPPASGAPSQETAQPPDNSAQSAPAPPPGVAASSAAPQGLPLGARATAPSPVSPPPHAAAPQPKPLARAPRPSGPTVRRTAPASSSAAAVPSTEPARPSQVRPEPEHGTRSSQAGRSQTSPAPPTPPEDTSSPEPAVDSQTGAAQDGSDTGEDAAPNPPAAPRSQAPAMRGSSMWQKPAPKPEEPQAGAAGPEITSPIERLHLATAAAEERGDLDTLRRLRATWKAFMVKIVGPDRSRAKREYADCLWAIQDLTGRRADQRDALAAYREYLLGAPAGGADSRSVSRLRQLEDALSERR
jgi:hypothetical protein